MTYQVSVKTCAGSKAYVPLKEDENPYTVFATYADMLLQGQDFLPEDAGDIHPVQVSLLHLDENQEPLLVSACYLLCSHDVIVDTEERAVSSLISPHTGRPF